MATLPPLCLAPAPAASRLHVVRKPAIRVRQAVRDNNVPLLARLQRKMDLRNTDRIRLTSLAWAALECNVEVFEWLLLDYGHDDQELSHDAAHNTIFHLLAACTAPLATSPHAHLLMSSPDFPPRPPNKTPTELIKACARMTEVYYTLFPFLVDWSNSSGKTALHVAAEANNAAFINQMCDLGADVSLADLQGNTPLHYASAFGHTESIRVLLERGAQVTLRNFEGFTAPDFAYSHHVRTALDAIAREVHEERKTRRKEERAMQKERERAERERWERERRESELAEAYERGQLREDARAYGNRLRSGSASTSASVVSAHSSSHSNNRRDPEPPLPPLPPSVAKAAAAAALARNERRAAERGVAYAAESPRAGSPTPNARRFGSSNNMTPRPGAYMPTPDSPTPRMARGGSPRRNPVDYDYDYSPTSTTFSGHPMQATGSQMSHAL